VFPVVGQIVIDDQPHLMQIHPSIYKAICANKKSAKN
jgi:hypothetical protein